ncbi:hypothetical protein [Sulfurimonas sp.]|jgi:hypothetical protein|uniref:hypothetical protein n=1 Tax=Sulfurimonas sp. TaxID=2022749 RepID=UPI002A361FE2|nr:hypothetical protein [Sulfurimonas sp.]MDY0123752.1 hypothetical protein [Sulfurimonas sp.]
MALSEEDRLWIEEKRRKIEREERELKRRGIIPYTEDELEEINAKRAEMREQAELNAEAIKKAGAFKRGLTTTTRFNPATGLPMIGEFDTSGCSWGHGN